MTWLRPNLAWAMDDCSQTVISGSKLHLHNLSDLCLRYKLPPIASARLPCGEEVAGHLDRLFTRFGQPLFCKRDNGGNLNNIVSTAWRIAAKQWLLQNELIRIVMAGEVLPNLSPIWSHH